MAGIHKFSAQVIDYAERLADVADAAQGKHQQAGGTVRRWVLLPASGAALYALLKSDFFSRQAKGVMDEAKTRASELPDDLVARVRQTAQPASRRTGSRHNSASTSRRTSAARKTKSASR
jgi:hypothetical protein